MNKLVDFPYDKVLVLGLAKSGTAAAKTLLENGINVRVNDMKTEENDPGVVELKTMGADVIVGSHPLSVLDDMELVVKNPGISYENPIIVEAMKRDIPIITEIEIAGRLAKGSIIGITGSNGKTTTTTLTNEMLLNSGQSVKLAGNIGIVATDVAKHLRNDEKMILELSSFQLMGVQTFRPNIAILINLFEAHLDYHKTFANYVDAKSNIFKHQMENDYLVYNADDRKVTEAVKGAKSIKVPFSVKVKQEHGAWANEESIFFKDEKIMDRKDIVLVGEHNLENILSAMSAAKLSGATNEGIRNVLSTFSGVKHRLQFVENINDRLFYNDSKATNILATKKALSSFSQPVVLLAGGLDRGNGFDEMIPALQHVKAMVVFGETAEKLTYTGEKAGVETIVRASNVEDAVREAYAVSEANDIILLSPACASWDQYRTFEERGDMFIHAVHTLK
ncbi:UDP-N-acetylmuramoyl-L-alanine--D-glutamate ligase [Ornithinibacillus sp. L9]|uniref:UDP-N-acetylmuramoylalanine--D-glutamate ligase n=1 Tax=Ornithinibacillus caprae TaxID=2678566 RepID=A0A6N8FK08_9BACI|nr:UDP-N-acetylmuramoyl-L-alanine--D-glutamate ligase [Ornithinibacillus caprae]MUK89531.1 UDP-N-acetylmuramoyl-L-alanine--D-glutamate ligase [Ornithinibacillus caprae]